MITVASAINQDFIIELLDGKTYDDITFKFEGKTGINLKFSVSTEDTDSAIAVAKKTIKSTEVGSVLYFQVK